MTIYQIVATGIIATVLALTIKRQNSEIGLMISIAASVLIFMMVIPRLSVVIDLLYTLTDSIGTGHIDSVMRIIGIAYIAQFGTQICLDAGESAIASKIELAGKVLIISISAPILMSLLELVLMMLP